VKLVWSTNSLEDDFTEYGLDLVMSQALFPRQYRADHHSPLPDRDHLVDLGPLGALAGSLAQSTAWYAMPSLKRKVFEKNLIVSEVTISAPGFTGLPSVLTSSRARTQVSTEFQDPIATRQMPRACKG